MTSDCGSNAGYVKHYYYGQSPCKKCRLAHARYQRAWDRANQEAARLFRSRFAEEYAEILAAQVEQVAVRTALRGES